MSIARSTIVRDPGLVVLGGSTYLYSKDDSPVVVTIEEETTAIGADLMGRLEDIPTNRLVRIRFRPVGSWESLSTLFAHAATARGASIFGASDTAVIIYTRSLKSYTFHAAAITQLPSIIGRVGETLLGEMEITAILKNSATPGESDAYYTLAEIGATYPGDSNFTHPITPVFGAVWGASSPWDSFHFEDGFEINFDLQIQPENVDGLGTVDMKFLDCLATLTGTPVGITPTQLVAAVNANAVLGSRNASGADDLVLSGTGAHITLYNATAHNAEMGFAASRKVPGALEWRANRSLTGGVLDNRFRVDTAAP